MLRIFLKKNMHRIMRVLVNQVGLMIFSTVMTSTAGVMREDLKMPMMVVASIFSICFYFFLVFYTMREEGSSDSVKIAGGRLAYDGAYGFKIGLCATAPNFVFSFLMILGLALGLETDAAGSLMDTAGQGVWTIGYSFITMFQSMYTGVLKLIVANLSPFASVVAATVCYTLTPMLVTIPAWLGYWYGCKKPMRRNGKCE